MPKALFVTTISKSARGGLLPLARHFRAKRWQVDVLAKDAPGCGACTTDFDGAWDIDWSRNPLHPRNFLSAPGIVRRVVTQGKYDLVHVHTPVAAFVSRCALRSWRAASRGRVIYTAHGFHFHPNGTRWKNLGFERLEKLAGHWTDHLVVINRTDYDAALRLGLVPSARLHLMPGIGVDTDRLRPDAFTPGQIRAVRKEFGIPEGAPLFTMAAEFIPRKRHYDLLRALARCQTRSAHLILPGTGISLEAAKALARALGIADRVHFAGFRTDVPLLMRASRASVLCSEQEGLPLAVIESLSVGCPAIGTSIRGTKDLLASGAGLLVKVGDEQAIAQAIDYMADHPDHAAQMGALAREEARQFDVRRIIGLHDQLYEKVLSE